MEKKQTFDQPSIVSADDGKVIVEGPDGVDMALTPDAAEETSDRLWTGALHARAQQRHDRKDGAEEDGDKGNGTGPGIAPDWTE